MINSVWGGFFLVLEEVRTGRKVNALLQITCKFNAGISVWTLELRKLRVYHVCGGTYACACMCRCLPVFLQSLSVNLDLLVLTRTTSQPAARMSHSQVTLPSLELQPCTAILGPYMGARDPTQDLTDGQQALDWSSHPSLSAPEHWGDQSIFLKYSFSLEGTLVTGRSGSANSWLLILQRTAMTSVDSKQQVNTFP